MRVPTSSPKKKQLSNKIDPVVPALMALGTFQAERKQLAIERSIYHKDRFLNLIGIKFGVDVNLNVKERVV